MHAILYVITYPASGLYNGIFAGKQLWRSSGTLLVELFMLGTVLSDSKMELAVLAGARSLVHYFMLICWDSYSFQCSDRSDKILCILK